MDQLLPGKNQNHTLKHFKQNIMLRSIFILFITLSLCAASFAQLSNIHTSQKDLVAKKYTKFILVNENTGYALGKQPVKFTPGGEMPECYFSVDLPANAASLATGAPRDLVLHTTEVPSEDWVLENNRNEGDIFFGRGRFVVNDIDKQWKVQVIDDVVIFQSKYDNNYLTIDQEGDLKRTSSMPEAARWKLYYVY